MVFDTFSSKQLGTHTFVEIPLPCWYLWMGCTPLIEVCSVAWKRELRYHAIDDSIKEQDYHEKSEKTDVISRKI
jgi:hypothetical protein